jgi:hypothetical protein
LKVVAEPAPPNKAKDRHRAARFILVGFPNQLETRASFARLHQFDKLLAGEEVLFGIHSAKQ